MRSRAIVAAVLTSASAAQAQEAMGTAGASGTPPASETARQIDDWIASSPAAREREESVISQLTGSDRQIHGEVGLAIGTNGYRSGYFTSVMPIGESGSLTLSYGQEKNGYFHYGYDGFGRMRTEPMLTPPMW